MDEAQLDDQQWDNQQWDNQQWDNQQRECLTCLLYLAALCLVPLGLGLGLAFFCAVAGSFDAAKDQVYTGINIGLGMASVGIIVLGFAIRSHLVWRKHERDEQIRSQDI